MAEVVLCGQCKLPRTSELHSCAEAMEKAMSDLLKNIGKLGTCSGCNAVIVWVLHRNGKHVPYTTEGLNHFVNCPFRERFGNGPWKGPNAKT